MPRSTRSERCTSCATTPASALRPTASCGSTTSTTGRWSLDVNVMGVVNGINAFVPTMLAQDAEGAVVNTTSGNGGFTPLIHSAIYATTKAAVTCLTECLWGQLRELGSKVTAHLLYPQGRSPGMLNTGIWRPGRHRPARYDRPGAPPPDTGRDQLTPMLSAGQGRRPGAHLRAAVGSRGSLLRGHQGGPAVGLPSRRRGEVARPCQVTSRSRPPRVPGPGAQRHDGPEGRSPGLTSNANRRVP